MKNQDIKVVAFDADDTLWDCQTWFDEVEQQCCELLKPWATAREVSEGLFATERKNLSLTGYGTKAFTLSLIENAVRVSHEQLTGDIVMRLLELGQQLLRFPTTPLPEVEETLQQLAAHRQYRLVVFTKGELMDQESKLQRSGLEQYFSHMETVSNKTERPPPSPQVPGLSTSPTMSSGSWRRARSTPTNAYRKSPTSPSCSIY